MKKRVKSFIMAILMVFTILPTNFTSVGAESDCKIYLKVFDLEGFVLDSKKFNVDVTNEDGTVVDEITHDIEETGTNKYTIIFSGFTDEKNYRIKIAYSGYLTYENLFKASTDMRYKDVTLLKDPFSSYDFKNLPDTMEMSAEETSIQTNIKPEEMDGFVQEFYSDNTDVATVDKSTGKILKISKPGKVTFRARLVNEEAHSYKEISKSVTMEKISHSLIPVKGKEPKAEIYTKQDGSALYKSSDDSYNGEITYSIDKADGADLAYTDENFEKNGKWKAKGTYGTVKVHVAAPETDIRE